MHGAGLTTAGKGYLLTALAAAGLLAAFPGTASAQTVAGIDFAESSVTVSEGGSAMVTVEVSNLPRGIIGTPNGQESPRKRAIRQLGVLTFSVENPPSGSQVTVDPESLDTKALEELLEEEEQTPENQERRVGLIVLTLSASADDNRENESFTLRVVSDNEHVDTGGTLQGTIEDSEPVPALPLAGSVLLALFLAAGGARLYQRSNG